MLLSYHAMTSRGIRIGNTGNVTHGSHDNTLEQGLQMITQEAEQFRHLINDLENSIKTLKHLWQSKSRYLDTATKLEIEIAISRSEDVLYNVDQTIDGYGHDTHRKGAIHKRHYIGKLFRNQTTPANDRAILTNCLHGLTIHIERLEAVKPPTNETAKVHTIPHASTYRDSLAPQTQGLRAPSARKIRSRQSLSKNNGFMPTGNLSTLSVCTEKEVNILPDLPGKDDNSSVLSIERRTTMSSSCTGAPSVFSDDSSRSTSCTGDYCTHDDCDNHRGNHGSEFGGGPGCPDDDEDELLDVPKPDMDPRCSDKILISRLSVSDGLWNGNSLRAPSRRRKIKSGLM